ncbi:ImmA/IrrE family metallo-endopeptidase [Ruminiclostridium cellobioparum]|uniref:ImmA/IrrE family metallo-endopeptidase n=1 Tax=Ruminiclostridium cellobioparum TaxID=29355 RepID=UPI0004806C04|nr:ImmA/IrrE family metallo-endopeptidase [Ruminiclostridium cellobioparum]
MTYDELVIQYDMLKIKEVDFNKIDPEEELSGLCINENILIRENIDTNVEKICVLAEELGHYFTTHGNILDQTKPENVKQEKRARNWAYEKLVPLERLIDAYENGIRNRFELSLHMGVTENFLEEAMRHYREKYGLYHTLSNYIIYFEPLGVFKVLE